ncbi:nucleotidyltransferase family protein [Phocaeicola plebeius]|uniref:nucleotidyltransferase family protein n=1 Tax=Phocaeicola plebeius TaxID=310297 RepID=UPI00294308AC|nr:nucleotidyltransferase domain-containing protein [Phocaeicola plebeius]
MKTKQEYLKLLSEYKQKRGLFYGISRICIFGSVARGEQTEDSDVDVCVDLEVPSIFSLVHIKEELRQLFGCDVDVVRFRQDMDTLLKHDILEEGIYV